MPNSNSPPFNIRNVKIADIKHVYPLLTANQPYVGLNSRYTYFLLAKDFSSTCVVAEHQGKIVAFSSGYVPPQRPDTFFSWEAVVHQHYRGHALQKRMLLHQINAANVQYFEGTVNPSNDASRKSFQGLAKQLHARCEETLLFSEEDFGNDGHEAEYLLRIGPIAPEEIKKQLLRFNCGFNVGTK
ncbi:MAG: diaminobutyrate acetyltransferase [Candidatus Bathyarchaeota archaeon]|nr:diaminobutyrate acetyltransferase [Candidatus Bathyarchaeota archaeon]